MQVKPSPFCLIPFYFLLFPLSLWISLFTFPSRVILMLTNYYSLGRTKHYDRPFALWKWYCWYFCIEHFSEVSPLIKAQWWKQEAAGEMTVRWFSFYQHLSIPQEPCWAHRPFHKPGSSVPDNKLCLFRLITGQPLLSIPAYILDFSQYVRLDSLRTNSK